jgi:hypothetical protein
MRPHPTNAIFFMFCVLPCCGSDFRQATAVIPMPI